MTKKHLLYIFGPFFFVWIVDRLTKVWASHLTDIDFYGPIGFVLHHNPGAILGVLGDLPPLLRVVSLSTGGAFLIFCFTVIQYLLPLHTLLIRMGMSFLLGGILGNVFDRILWGYVVDFIVLRVGSFTSPAFNMADALQWVGYFTIMYCLIKDGKNLWPDDNLRKSFIIDFKYQVKYSLKLSSLALCFAVISGTLSYTFLKVTISELVGHDTIKGDHFLVTFLVTYFLVSLVFCAILFVVGLVLSHRAAGPIYAFQRFLEDLLAGKPRPLKLRDGDEFRQLEQLAERLTRWK